MYWDNYDINILPKKKDYGQCRKNTPELDPRGQGVWPETSNHDGCYSGTEKLPEVINE